MSYNKRKVCIDTKDKVVVQTVFIQKKVMIYWETKKFAWFIF